MCSTIYFFTKAKKRGLIDKKMITLQTNPEIFMQEFFFCCCFGRFLKQTTTVDPIRRWAA